jgi:CRP-like cAMP-binding protein
MHSYEMGTDSESRGSGHRQATHSGSGSGSEEFRSLRRIEVLEDLPVDEIDSLAARLPTLRLQKGNLLFTPLHRWNLSFFLLEGSVRLYKASEGSEITLELVHAGGMFSNSGLGGAISNVPTHEGDSGPGEGLRSGVYAQALRHSRVAMIRNGHFGRLVAEHPQVGFKAMSILERRLSLYGERMFDMATKEVPGRLARLLISLLEDEGVVDREGIKLKNSYTHEELATMVGSKRVAVTRAFKELKRSGVDLQKRHIRVADMAALRQAAAA